MKTEGITSNSEQNSRITELWLHYLWKERAFSEYSLVTSTGDDLKVLFSGWYNKGWGPDFKDARIEIQGVLYFGDVEIHIEEAAWNRHSHQVDEVYNKVVLHVFLIPAKTRVKNQLNRTIPSLAIQSPALQEFWDRQFPLTGVQIKELPGACGLMLSEEKAGKLKQIIRQAAENRLVAKSLPLAKQLDSKKQSDAEDLLFTIICKSLGYSANSGRFVALSERYPYSAISAYFKIPHRQSRVEVLCRWFGYLGFLSSIDIESIHQELRREWLSLIQTWNQLKDMQELEYEGEKSASRPLNNPVRRLTGLYYHLDASWFQGLIKTWLIFFHRCQNHIHQVRARQLIIKELDSLFPQPEWDLLNIIPAPNLTTKKLPRTKLIGKSRQLIILVNSILPFFLAWSRIHQDLNLEKTLFSLFLILPGEGGNRKTSFMENRLFTSFLDFHCEKNLGYCQGLIQIHDDCCTSFYEGCDNCSLLKLLH
jgi:Protein of unknown function (DUF2851)